MKKIIQEHIEKALTKLGATDVSFVVEHPADLAHGDFATNVALSAAKKLGKKPREVADLIVAELTVSLPVGVSEKVIAIEIAGPGFINFRCSVSVFVTDLTRIISENKMYGSVVERKGQKVMVEFTDPNPFKIFHIGHLMSNTIGEAIARIMESSGAEVVRACYQGDVGLHVARTMWGILQNKDKFPKESVSLVDRIKFLGDMYVIGANIETPEALAEIAVLNKKIFEKSDSEINEYYTKGRTWSLEYFETIYKKLGTKFVHYFFESEVADEGVRIVREFLKKDIFEESDGAIVFKGEEFGLHTRVFINSQGLPTYEAKEIGLNKRKFEVEPTLTESIIITANEQSDYFKVLLKVFSLVYPEIAAKTKHFSHGMLRFASGKMSSRKGNIIAAETLITDVENLVLEKIKDRGFDAEVTQQIAYDVAAAAIKYSILRQSVGGDIIYDVATSVSFEGDSGPYLQYSCVRARSVVGKAQEIGIKPVIDLQVREVSPLEKMMVRYPEILERARTEYAPHYIVTYLTELASAFNAYYAENKIIDATDTTSAHKVAVTQAFAQIMENGLLVIGIRVPAKM
ncbi:MAG: arginine--tRNA ligase [Candidatus Taylorbacteria bacterium]|nr:arginine--tRNA ligase [Candidatus Taylorbacteria bacterium]